MIDVDVVIIGAGMAGLSAAIAAAEAGATVLLVERAPAVGGSMAISGGVIWTARSLEQIRAVIPHGDPELQRLLVEGIEATWSWLDGHGLPLTPEVTILENGFGRARLIAAGEVGARQPFADAMAAVAVSLGAAIRTGVVPGPPVPLDGRWLIALHPTDGTERVRARSVVMATGGFQNDADLVRRFITPHPERLIIRSNPVSGGYALHSRATTGAALSGSMSSFYGHSLAAIDPSRLTPQLFTPISQYYSDFCVAVNELGLRFADEAYGLLDEHNAQHGSRQPGGRYFLIFDERIRRTYAMGDANHPGLEANVGDRVEVARTLGAPIVEADTLEELAAGLQRLGVCRENVLETIATYNAAGDATLVPHPRRTGKYIPLMDPPFYAVECRAGITYTMGGLRVDPSCTVLDVSGAPIAGLFAAGADAGGVFNEVYGGGLAWAATSGREAGRSAATHAQEITRSELATR